MGIVDPAGDAGARADASAHDASNAMHDGGKSPSDSGMLPSDSGVDVASVEASAEASVGCAGNCPPGYICGSANGLAVCRAPSGVPLFAHVFVIMEENTSLSTLNASLTANAAPNFESLRATYATGTGYHGVAHPSLPNYIALTSGGTQGIGCDCQPAPGQGTCGSLDCNLLLGSCSCAQAATNLADQVETAHLTWTAFGEGMGAPCNLTDDTSTNYAVRHVPFLYYDDVQTDTTRCSSHVVDYASFDPTTAPNLTYIAPNLIHDMHNPIPAAQGNITSGDTWIGPTVATILASAAYKDGGLLVIVWDEDDGSGGITGSDDPVPIFVISPYAKHGGYMSAADMDHYSLLATIEDGLGLPRLGAAGVPRATVADSLADYFPAH
jgi:hypothetical protein